MHIISDNDTRDSMIERYASLNDVNVTLVQMEGRYPNAHLQDVAGLSEALKVVDDSTPMILLGWQPPKNYASRPEWHAALARPNVVFAQLPASADAVSALIENAAFNPRPADPLAIELLTITSYSNSQDSLMHDLYSARREAERMTAWLKRARTSLGNHSDDELVRLVEANERPTAGPLAGRQFPDVCVDVEGTLLDDGGNLRTEVVDRVNELARERPVTIWTGGDHRYLEGKLRLCGLTWKLVSKHSLAGAAVHAVVDNLTESEFQKQYAVNYDVYLQV